MGANTAENTNLRLKAVLDILAEGVWSGEKLNAGAVLGKAIERVPLNEYEGELLSGGIPRGHKALTSATAKLVKAGWLVKGRSGWSITEDGQRATVAFADPAAFTAAVNAGTPVPAGTPLPPAPAQEPAQEPAATDAGKAAGLIEDAVAPAAKAERKRKAAAPAQAAAETTAETTAAASAETAAPAPAEAAASNGSGSNGALKQPSAVAVAGDFNVLLGAPANWAPQYDEAQMELDLADQLWKIAVEIPAGNYSFKIALNRSWDENYGAYGVFDGANHEVHHGGGLLVIQYDHRTRDIALG